MSRLTDYIDACYHTGTAPHEHPHMEGDAFTNYARGIVGAGNTPATAPNDEPESSSGQVGPWIGGSIVSGEGITYDTAPPQDVVPVTEEAEEEVVPITEEDEPRVVALGDLFTAYELDIIENHDQLATHLTKLGYDADQQPILFGLADNAKAMYLKAKAKEEAGEDPPELSLGTVLKAFQDETTDEAELVNRLTTMGYNSNDVDLLIEMNQPEPIGLSAESMVKAYQGGYATPERLRSKLTEEGYGGRDIDLIMKANAPEGYEYLSPVPDSPEYGGFLKPTPQKPTTAQEAPASGGGGGGAGFNLGNTVAGSSYGAAPTRPRAADLLQDFRTSLSQNLRSQAPSLSVDARRWAMENADMFLDDYLGGLGHGGVPGQGVFTKGAAEIQTLYESQKNNRAARMGGGPASVAPRSI